MLQTDLFGAENLAATTVLPTAPALQPHTWPFPGLTAEDSARAVLSRSDEYVGMLIAVIKRQGGIKLTQSQLLALIPDDWKAVLGCWMHTSLSQRIGEQHGIDVKYISHDDGGFHFQYQAVGAQSRLA